MLHQIELADIIQRRLKDPRHGFITVTGVEVAPDLRSARVFISTLDDAELDASLATLERASGFIRSELGQRIRLRYTPELRFRPDRSAERAMRVAGASGRVADLLFDDLCRDLDDDVGAMLRSFSHQLCDRPMTLSACDRDEAISRRRRRPTLA